MKFGTGAIATLKNGSSQVDKLMLGAATVWTSFSAQWSGDSLWFYSLGSTYFGFHVSGNLLRYEEDDVNATAWITANIDGTFTGNSLRNDLVGYETSGNSIRVATNNVGTWYYGAWLPFTIGSGFADGHSDDSFYKQELRASGGLIRSEWNAGQGIGAWVSLT